VQVLAHLRTRTADQNFYYGTALAQLQQWQGAGQAFAEGSRLAPGDPKFLVEGAGAEFKQKHNGEAIRLLRRALRLAPHDPYTNDFLGTLYFLDGNLEAALKYWNRVGKPEIDTVRAEPQPRVSPVLLDRAFAFSSAATMRVDDLIDTQARIRGMGIFPQFQIDLRARDSGKFDAVFRNEELDGFGRSKPEALIQLFRGLPFQSVNPEYYNLRHEAINIVSMYRWDAQKRRAMAELSGPFERSARIRYQAATDWRDENWVLRSSFTGAAPALGELKLRLEMLDLGLGSFSGKRWAWSGGAEVSHRDFLNVVAGTALTPELLSKGYQLKQRLAVTTTLWGVPERRFTVDAGASSQAARLWSQKSESFEKLQGSLGWHWLPQAEGDDYEMRQQLRAGKTFGTVPFDELFMLGLERDNDLLSRAHIGTRDGRKGSAPLGKDYLLMNFEADKKLYSNGIVTVKLGPFLDSGAIRSEGAEVPQTLGSQKWLWDIGAQVKLRVFGSGVVFSYGKDLRSGNNAFYLTLLK
jgi:hypothetical protein